jgi:hypothetical protein
MSAVAAMATGTGGLTRQSEIGALDPVPSTVWQAPERRFAIDRLASTRKKISFRVWLPGHAILARECSPSIVAHTAFLQ